MGEPVSTAKQDVSLLLQNLPENCSLEEIQYHLYVLEKVRAGMDSAESRGTLTQNEVEQRLSKWLKQ